MRESKKNRLFQLLEWAGHFETVVAIVQGEFVRTLLWPMVTAVMAAAGGYLGGYSLMWIVMATMLTFAATLHALHTGSQYIERKNPRGKLRYVQSHIAMDLVPAAPNRAQLARLNCH